MPTGSLRYVYDKTTGTGYTWRVYFGGELPDECAHYTVTSEPIAYLEHLCEVASEVGFVPTSGSALNITLTGLPADLLAGTHNYVEAMLSDPDKRKLAQAESEEISTESQALAATLSTDVDSILQREPFLLRSGLMVRTSRGRVATRQGYRVLGMASPIWLPA